MSVRLFSPTARAFWGLLLGLALGAVPALRLLVPAIEPVGTLWINAIRMTVIPLVVSLLVTGVASAASARRVGRLGMQSIILFLVLLIAAALFTALVFWNDWYLALLFINSSNLVPLQYLLYQISTDITTLQTSSQAFGVQVPALSAQMAIAVLAVGPITLAFLFVQKYFVSGITLGGVKGD